MESMYNCIDRKFDILLVIPPPFWTKMPHLGVAYLDTFLKSKGIESGVYDLNLLLYGSTSAEMYPYWQIDCLNHYRAQDVSQKISDYFKVEIDNFVEEFIASDIPVIGFSVNVISIFVANKIAKLIKSKDRSRTIIFGGPATFFKTHRKLIDFCFADFFVIGEGELVLLGLLDKLKNVAPVENGNGILLGQDYDRYDVPAAKPIESLNSIPFPDFSGFDLEEYTKGCDRKLPLLFSRGCIGRCSYCIDCIMWPGLRCRSAGHIFEEMRYHVAINKVKAFEVNDLACNGDLKQLYDFCNLVGRSGFIIPDWTSYAIIRKDMDETIFPLLKKSGCHTLIYGLESGSDKVLKRMRKIYTVKDAQRVIRLTHEAGIRTNINIIVGFPGEKEEDFNETIDFLIRNRPYIGEVTNVSSFVLFPDADVGRNKDNYGVIWQEGIEPILCRDKNGLDYQKRAARVGKMQKILCELGLRKSIVNKPDPTLARHNLKLTRNKNLFGSRAGKIALVLPLFLFSLILETYLYFAKKIRKTVIFPGG